MHLCTSNACQELPHRTEEFARNVYSYIMNSLKRLSEYTQTQPHKILQSNNPVTKMFFAFLAFILPSVKKVNVEFQATSFRVYKLRNSINSSVKAVLSYFTKNEALKDKELSKLNLNDPSNYLKIEDIYQGARVESIALESSSSIS